MRQKNIERLEYSEAEDEAERVGPWVGNVGTLLVGVRRLLGASVFGYARSVCLFEPNIYRTNKNTDLSCSNDFRSSHA
jgi:hypothetical protein